MLVQYREVWYHGPLWRDEGERSPLGSDPEQASRDLKFIDSIFTGFYDARK
jgi:hypothetical protein